jgi:hypothetical protein
VFLIFVFVSNDYSSACNLIRTPQIYNGIALFIDSSLKVTREILKAAESFSYILAGLAEHVFNMPTAYFHIFHDVDSPQIAFNSNGSLFFNVRFFKQVHMKQQQQPLSFNASACSYWYTVAAHELAHNIEADHNAKHGDAMRAAITHRMEHWRKYMNSIV